jgi:hypothetical protein
VAVVTDEEKVTAVAIGQAAAVAVRARWLGFPNPNSWPYIGHARRCLARLKWRPRPRLRPGAHATLPACWWAGHRGLGRAPH